MVAPSGCTPLYEGDIGSIACQGLFSLIVCMNARKGSSASWWLVMGTAPRTVKLGSRDLLVKNIRRSRVVKTIVIGENFEKSSQKSNMIGLTDAREAVANCSLSLSRRDLQSLPANDLI